MTTARVRSRRIGQAALVTLFAITVVSGCARTPMSTTLPPLIEERVPGAYDVEFRAGTTASPGLQTIDVTFMLEREPVTADDLSAVIDAIYTTNSLGSVYTVSVSAYADNPDGTLGCRDLGDALDELGLGDDAFTPYDCTRLLADFGDLRDWWQEQHG